MTNLVVVFIFTLPLILTQIQKGLQKDKTDFEKVSSVKYYTVTDPNAEFNLQQYKDQNLVINLWSTWCIYCIEELPHFSKLQSEYPEKITVIAINRGEPLDANRSFFEVTKIDSNSIIFLIDKEDRLYKEIDGIGMPETIFINKHGEIVEHVRGPLDFDKMKSIVETKF